METFESKIDLFDNIYGHMAVAEITTSDHKAYFTVLRPENVDYIEIYDMKHGHKFIVEGEFLIVCTLLGLSLDPMALDPVSVTDDSIDLVDSDGYGSYTVTVENGKWLNYDFDFEEEGGFGPSLEECKEAIKAVWAHYNEDPDMVAIYNG